MATEIDWTEQWAMHAPEFHDGRAHVHLPNSTIIELLPGPGFGDCSHPTTKLVLDLMACFVDGETIFDIGSGSGILSIAAGKMGAKKIYACDIDPHALEHTIQNGIANQLTIETTTPLQCNPVVLMNMIACEQREAWSTHQMPFKTLITSGILTTEKKEYLTYAYAQGWQLLNEASHSGWLAYVFKEKS